MHVVKTLCLVALFTVGNTTQYGEVRAASLVDEVQANEAKANKAKANEVEANKVTPNINNWTNAVKVKSTLVKSVMSIVNEEGRCQFVP